jgi:hypothetical protein
MQAMVAMPVNAHLLAFAWTLFAAVLTAMKLDVVVVPTALRTVFVTFLTMNAGFKVFAVSVPAYPQPASPLGKDYAVAMESSA